MALNEDSHFCALRHSFSKTRGKELAADRDENAPTLTCRPQSPQHLRDRLRGEEMNRPDKRNSLTQYSNRLDTPAPTRARPLSTNLQSTRWPLAPLAQFSTRIDRRSLVLYSSSTNLLIRVSTQLLYTGLHNCTQLCTVSYHQSVQVP